MHLHQASFESPFLLLGIGPKFFLTPLPGVDETFPNTIAQNIWSFCLEYKIEIKHNIDVTLLRDHNLFLMEHFTSVAFNDQDKNIINKCRVYLKILTLSDMVTGDGTMILLNVWEGRIVQNNLCNLKWPK